MERFAANQDLVAAWKMGMLGHGRDTPRAEFDRALEEVTEIDKAIEVYDGSRRSREDAGGELADAVVGFYGVAIVMGVDLDKMVREKILLARDKYPPREITNIMQTQGLLFDQAMEVKKSIYQNRTRWEKRWQKRLLS